MLNPEKKYSKISIAVAVLAAVFIFLPGWVGMDGMKGGYALSFVAAFIAISALVITWFFRGRGAALDRIFRGEELLAHWTYTLSEWQNYAEAKLVEQTRANKSLWFIVAGFCVLIGGLFWLFDHEAGGFVMLVMIALSLLLAIVAIVVPRLRFNRQQRGAGEAWIARDGIYFAGNLVRWNSWGASLEGVEWQEASGSAPACLKFELSYPSRTGRQNQSLRIPIPFGKEDEAHSILEQITVVDFPFVE